mgnify:CR=1 FL=1
MLNPLIGPRVIAVTAVVTQDELYSRVKAQKRRHRDLRDQFNPEDLLAQVIMPECVSQPAPAPPRVGLVRRSMARANLKLSRTQR